MKLWCDEAQQNKTPVLFAPPTKGSKGATMPGGPKGRLPLDPSQGLEEELTEEELLRLELEKQQNDIRLLRKEIEMKKSRINEVNEETKRSQKGLARMKDDNTDAARLTPEEEAYIKQLQDELKRIDEDLTEAEAKNRLYYLLGERTRREHQGMDQKVRELKKRQQKQQERERKLREKQLEKERQEKEASLKLKAEHDAYELKVQALAPKVQAMEASWNRIRATSGAETAEDVIAYWEGLRAKEEQMRELVKLAEGREASAKAEIGKLIESRSFMFEKPEGTQEQEGDIHEQKARTDEAERRMEQSRQKFNQLRSVSISAEQGLKSLVERLMVALEEVPADTYRTNQLKGMPNDKNRGGAAARAVSPARRSSAVVATPDRKSRTPRTSTTPLPKDGAEGGTAAGDTGGDGDKPGEDGAGHMAADAIPAGDTATSAGASMVPEPSKSVLTEGNTIDDEQFFPELPEMLSGLTDRLAKVMLLSHTPTLEGEEGAQDAETEDDPGLLTSSEKDMDSTSMMPTMKRKKGKKKEGRPTPALERVMGYAGSDMSASEEEQASEEEEEDEEDKEDGIMERDFIKLRALKMSHRHGMAKQ
eukprot:gene4200-14305_t